MLFLVPVNIDYCDGGIMLSYRTPIIEYTYKSPFRSKSNLNPNSKAAKKLCFLSYFYLEH
jgi:hypothetical protein